MTEFKRFDISICELDAEKYGEDYTIEHDYNEKGAYVLFSEVVGVLMEADQIISEQEAAIAEGDAEIKRLKSIISEVPELLREQVFDSDDGYVAADCLLVKCENIRQDVLEGK